MHPTVEPGPVHGFLAELPVATARGQRWKGGRHRWSREGASAFRADRYRVSPLDEAEAKAWVQAHHYSGTYPAAAKRYGLRLAHSGELVGVAVYGIPAQARVLTNVFPDLEPYRQSLELSRFVLTDEDYADGPLAGQPKCPTNSESWFIARTFSLLHADGVHGVVSFADPVPRRRADGTVLFCGHAGFIYQASNAVLTGRGSPRSVVLLPDGTTLSDRALQKVRGQEQGHEYVERRLISWGAPVPRGGADRVWLTEALSAVGARRLRHGGNHRYAMVTHRRLRAVTTIVGGPFPYPKAADPA